MSVRQNVYTGAPWEKKVAYCRAKRVGNAVYVSGTVAVDEAGQTVGRTMYEQATFIFQKIERALKECGAARDAVVRTRMFVTNIDGFDGLAQAHREAFEGIDPVATCVEITRLVSPDLLVEIEVDAVITE